MEETTFWQYVKLALSRAFRDFKWARDTAIGGAFSLASLVLQASWRLISHEDWSQHKWRWVESVVLPIIAALAINIAWRLVTAPWRVYQDQEQDHEKQRQSLITEMQNLKDQLREEHERSVQPDVALVWDWTDDEKPHKDLMGQTEKHILIQNRSDHHIYNVQVETIKLPCELRFDLINEIGPHAQEKALGRWDGRSSLITNYVYFFSRPENEQGALENGWVHKKEHNRGMSDSFLKIPMAITYEARNRRWRCEFEFVYDPGDESMFLKKGAKLQ